MRNNKEIKKKMKNKEKRPKIKEEERKSKEQIKEQRKCMWGNYEMGEEEKLQK
jgi:hypothetical protein